MTEVWTLAALWPGLALVATLALRISIALSEIVVGNVEQSVRAPWFVIAPSTTCVAGVAVPFRNVAPAPHRDG